MLIVNTPRLYRISLGIHCNHEPHIQSCLIKQVSTTHTRVFQDSTNID